MKNNIEFLIDITLRKKLLLLYLRHLPIEFKSIIKIIGLKCTSRGTPVSALMKFNVEVDKFTKFFLLGRQDFSQKTKGLSRPSNPSSLKKRGRHRQH